MKTKPGLLVMLLALTVACDSFNFNPFKTDDPEPDDQATVIETVSQRVGSNGGTLVLKSGIQVSFPQGALVESEMITIKQLDPDFYFEPGNEKKLVVSCTSGIDTFFKNIEIRFPMPGGFTDIDSTLCFGGIIDEETGAVEVMEGTIDWTHGTPMLVIKTNHFSKYTGWFWEPVPTSSGPLSVPYYNQGSSTYCWAVCMQMACEAARPSLFEIFDIIGRLGYDETGITQYSLRFNSEIAQMIFDRTGVSPDRQLWPVGSARTMDNYLRNRIALGYPVLIHSPVIEHAFLVVGYDGTDFIMHDPNNTTINQIGYQKIPWKSFRVTEMETSAKFVTLSIPAKIQNGSLNKVNMVNSCISFIQPKTERVKSNIYRYDWDYTVAEGYSFRNNNGTGLRVDTIPGEVNELAINGVELTNASLNDASKLTVFIYVTGLENEKVSKTYFLDQAIDLAPNSLTQFKKTIKVDDFRDKSGKVTKYQLSIDILNNGTVEDQSTINFYLAPQEEVPELISLSPSKVKKGDVLTINGKFFGEQQNQSTATLNGKEMAVKSWSAEKITCTVPADATSGNVAVTVNNMKSNELYCEVNDEKDNSNVYWPKAFICREIIVYNRLTCDGDEEIYVRASILNDTIRGSNGVYNYSKTVSSEEVRSYFHDDCESRIVKEINELSTSMKLTFKPDKEATNGESGTVSVEISRNLINKYVAENGESITTTEDCQAIINDLPSNWNSTTRPFTSYRLVKNADAQWAVQYIKSMNYSYTNEKCNSEVLTKEGCNITIDNLNYFTFIISMYELK